MSRRQANINVYDSTFDRNSPRPPVPGEESLHMTNFMEMDYSSKRHLQHEQNFGTIQECKEHQHRSSSEDVSPPAYMRWAMSLHYLLEDPDGLELFKKFLQAEGHSEQLDFWFACQGLKKKNEPEVVQHLVKAIYRRFFLKKTLPINEDIKREVGRRVVSIGSNQYSPNLIFDEAQAQIESIINDTTYPNFIKSDMYLQYIQSIQNPTGNSGEFSNESSSSSSSISNKDHTICTCCVGPLPIIFEDRELHPAASGAYSYTPGASTISTGYHTPNLSGSLRLTKDVLLATQKNRAMDVRPKPEAFAADMYMYRGTSLHLAYNSYNPVSRQDSEMQSLSSHSDGRTDYDSMSLVDSSIDGRSLHRRRKAALEARHVRENAVLNKETNMHQTVIPRTQRQQQGKPLSTKEFAAILTQKLECVKRDQDRHEILERKLSESDSTASTNEKSRMNEIQSRELANAIWEKLQLEDDNCQNILDEHVSIVFSDSTSPVLSPGIASPRYAAVTRRWQGAHSRSRRRDKDGFSTFSGDSGNVHDFAEGSEHKMIVKSKSMPEYAEDRERFVRGSISRRSSSKKTLTDLTDSGVSVVSDTPPVGHLTQVKDYRLLAWVKESERANRTTNYNHGEVSSKHRSHRSSSATSPNANRHRKGYGSRSNSLERSGASNSLAPAQPFVADPSMPPLPQPNTAIQLEEARRRLMEDELRTRSRQRMSSTSHYPDASPSSQSTLKKPARGSRQSTVDSEEVTTVLFTFCDEQFPYRTKIPGKQVTLKQFKEYLPKKGNYRYFFKTECEELDNQIIQEEISNDADILPLWEGRINAQVKFDD